MIKIVEGWNFFSADFSRKCSATPNYYARGSVTLKRVQEDVEKWHSFSDEEREVKHIFVYAEGDTLEQAIQAANWAAAKEGSF